MREIIQSLSARGIQLWVDGEMLRYRGPLIPEDLDTLKLHKAEILEVLKFDLDPAPPEGDLSDFAYLLAEVSEPDRRQLIDQAAAGEQAGQSREDAEQQAVQAWIQTYKANRASGNQALPKPAAEPGHCSTCGQPAELQDRARDAWWCAGCREWMDGAGVPLPSTERAGLMTAEDAAARRLLADLLAAGCGFVMVDDELRMTNQGAVPAALWLRFEAAGQDFAKLARAEAERAAASGDPVTVSEAFN